MLGAIRKHAGSWVVKVLLGILVASFAIWGIGDIFRAGFRSDDVAEIGGVKISAASFQVEFDREMQNWRQSMPEFSQEQALGAGLDERVLTRMVTRTVLDQAAFGMDLRVSDKEVARTIRDIESFKDSLGVFNRLQYEALLRRVGFTEAAFEAQTRQDIARQHLIDAMIGGRRAPEGLANALYAHLRERRDIDILYLPNSGLAKIAEPDAAALDTFYKGHIDRFTAPEHRAATYLALSPETAMPNVAIADEAAREHYEAHLDSYVEPERREIMSAVYKSEEDARAARKLIEAGASFAEVAEKMTGATEAEMVLGAVSQKDLEQKLGKDIADAAFTLQAGAVTEPLKSQFGTFNLVRVSGVTPGSSKPFETVRDDIRHALALEKAKEELYSLVNTVEDELAAGATIEEVGKKFNLATQTVQTFDKSGRTPSGEAAAVPTAPEFLKAAFESEPGEALEVIPAADDAYFVIRVDSVTPSAPKPIAEVRAEVAAAWLADERAKAAEARAKGIVAKVKDGGKLEEIAKSEGGVTMRATGLLRDGSGSQVQLTRALVDDIFGKKRGEAGYGATQKGDGFIVFVVAGATPGEPGGDPAGLMSLGEALREAFAEDLLRQYEAHLEKEFGVTIRRDLVKKILSPSGGQS